MTYYNILYLGTITIVLREIAVENTFNESYLLVSLYVYTITNDEKNTQNKQPIFRYYDL